MIALLVAAALAQDYEKLAPYSAIRWSDESPEVEIDGAWVGLVAMDATPAAEIVAFAKRTWPRIWKKRFEEDLVEVLSKMGKPPGATVSLEVRDGAGERTLEGVPMTKENRRKILEAARARELPPMPRSIAKSQAAADLDQLKRLIDDHYAYAALRGVRYVEAIREAKEKLAETVEIPAFALAVETILIAFQDGHTGVQAVPFAEGCAPFLFAEVGGRMVAFKDDRSGFVDREHPFVKSIDGVEISTWLDAAGRRSPIPARRARALRFAVQLRRDLGLPEAGMLKVELASEQGKTRTLELAPTRTRPTYGTWPRQTSKILDGNLGYLRLAEMDDPAVDAVRRAMGEFRKTAGLVIDVRGNGGGSRAALRALFPYFMKEGDTPRVANVAASREEGVDLSDRWLFPVDSPRWNDAELEAIRKLTFKPEWDPPAGKFGAWHYFVLSPGGAPFHYGAPVVVLMDGDCFSATDIFLGAFKGWRNVTLVGARSGGGSGRALPYELKESGLPLRLSSMASFQADGRLYDGRGVEPDVAMEIAPTDLVNQTDTVLDAAVRRLRK